MPLTQGGVVYATATQITTTAVGTVGQVLTSQATAAPTWTTISGTISGLTTGTIPVATSSTTIGDSILTKGAAGQIILTAPATQQAIQSITAVTAAWAAKTIYTTADSHVFTLGIDQVNGGIVGSPGNPYFAVSGGATKFIYELDGIDIGYVSNGNIRTRSQLSTDAAFFTATPHPSSTAVYNAGIDGSTGGYANLQPGQALMQVQGTATDFYWYSGTTLVSRLSATGALSPTSITPTNPVAVTSGGTGVTTSTGTGSVVLNSSPTFTGTISAANLTLSTPLAVTSGGTGQGSALTAGGFIYATSTTAMANVAGTTGQVLVSQGASAPTFSSMFALLF